MNSFPPSPKVWTEVITSRLREKVRVICSKESDFIEGIIPLNYPHYHRFYMKSLKIDLWSRKWKWLVIKKWNWLYGSNSFLPSPKAWARVIITRLIEKVKVISFIHHPSDISFTSLSNGDTIGQISALHQGLSRGHYH